MNDNSHINSCNVVYLDENMEDNFADIFPFLVENSVITSYRNNYVTCLARLIRVDSRTIYHLLTSLISTICQFVNSIDDREILVKAPLLLDTYFIFLYNYNIL